MVLASLRGERAEKILVLDVCYVPFGKINA